MKGVSIPGPYDKITKYTICNLGDAAIRARVEKRLEQHPALKRIYDTDFLDDLVPDRTNLDNELLVSLADTADPAMSQFWAEVSRDLHDLEDAGAFTAFFRKLRQREELELNVAKTELELGAWMRRRCKGTAQTRAERRCEFSAASDPPTSWEVKTTRDQQPILAQQKAQEEVKRGFGYFHEPYVLQIHFADVSIGDPHSLVKAIRQGVRRFHSEGGQPLPTTFKVCDVTVTVLPRSDRAHGYQRYSLARYRPAQNDVERILDLARDAIDQFPDTPSRNRCVRHDPGRLCRPNRLRPALLRRTCRSGHQRGSTESGAASPCIAST